MKCFRGCARQNRTMTDLYSRKAKLEACKVIERFGIIRPEDIRLKDIAVALGVENVVEGPLEGAAASLVTLGEQTIIRISDRDTNTGRKRFSIAHELGHFVLGHGHTLQKICSNHDLHTWYGGGEEAQANTFAAELLLPSKFVEPFCDIDASGISFDLIRKLATDFRVSLTAAAIRFVELCPEPCAVVFSKQNKTSWSYTNDEWKPYIERDVPLDRYTVAYDLHHGEEMEDLPVEVETSAWVDWQSPDTIMEHSVGFPGLGFVLSLLWMKNNY